MYGPSNPYVRHVATASGVGGQFKILFDHSLGEYVVSVTRNIKTWVEIKGEFLQAQRTFVYKGTFDLVVALVQPEARGSSQEFPDLVIGPGANDDERAQVDRTFDPDVSTIETPKLESLNIDW